MKRSFYNTEIDSITMANCLMLLSQGKETRFPSFEAMKDTGLNSPGRVFECKTCNRQFPSFQALGGHRASHKKPRLMGGDGSLENQTSSLSSSSPVKPKTHECSICGLEFAIGQALGGHMRRHRAALSNNNHNNGDDSAEEKVMVPPPILKKSNSKRVLCLDLNLTPYENDLEFFRLVGKEAPMVLTVSSRS
ncbi:hypothetical protein JCGZ_18434 [Jatropha curcas]|uniref:C2H2-type domain-containing protein n=1 Tax=Jatropha curcas TaxID=180498 RepID=A0A067KDD3_JATCU|nr:zinc finger protein ZAT12 [Jatropha curcas]KDP29859.1 hypothetical protein JCGZ_18434 [Jatropha curcas]